MKYPPHTTAHQSLESIEEDECSFDPNGDITAKRFRTLFNEIERLRNMLEAEGIEWKIPDE
jgi:hypothetical protein